MTCVGYAQALGSRARRRLLRLGWRLAAALLGVAAAAHAQQGPEAPTGGLALSSTLERIGPAATIDSQAGELVLSVAFTNTGAQVVDAVRITSPVPLDVRYVAGSATGPGSHALFSVDQGRTFGRPEELTVVGAEGVERADAADYTHVRWVLDGSLDAGATGVVRFRAVPR